MATCVTASWASPLRVVALTGQASETEDGEFFDQLYSSTINDAGDVAFRGVMRDANGRLPDARAAGIWTTFNGVVRNVLRATDDDMALQPWPGSETIYASGDVHFRAATNRIITETGSVSGTPRWWTDQGGELSRLIDPTIPFAGRDAEFDPIFFNEAVFNSLGRGVFQDLNEGIWVGGPTTRTVVLEGDQVPTPDGQTNAFQTSFTVARAINDQESVAFGGYAGQPGEDAFGPAGLWLDRNGNTSLVALAGEPAFGDADGPRLTSVPRSDLFDLVEVTNQDAVVFNAIFEEGLAGITSANDEALLMFDGSSTRTLVQEGQDAPGTGGTFHEFRLPFWHDSSIVVNGQGDIAFASSVLNGQNRMSGVWAIRSGELEFVTDTTFGGGGGVVAINDRGQVAVSTSEGLMVNSPDGSSEVIAIPFESFEIAPGDNRRIDTLYFDSNGFNNRGQITFAASFLDGTSGAFIYDTIVPEPAAGRLLLFSCWLALCLTRRQRRG